MREISHVLVLLLALVGHCRTATASSLIQYSESEIMDLDDSAQAPLQGPLQWGFSTSPSDPTVTIYRERQFDRIIDVTFNTGNIWSNERPVEIKFSTSSSPSSFFFEMKWTATLHRITSVNGQRKYIRNGLMSDTRRSLQRLHKYHVKFLPPPTIEQPGEYLIVFAIEMWTYRGRYKPVMIVSKPVRCQSTAYHRSTFGSLESNALTHRSGLVNEIPTEIINSILNEMASPGDACAFCSQSKVVRIQCDEVLSRFHFSPDFDLQEEARSIVEKNAKHSTSELCKIASVDRILQRLEFKYEESELTRILNDDIRSETTIQTFKSTIINGHGNIPASFSLWAALIYQNSFTDPFVKRNIDIRGRMDRFFDFGRKWPTLDSTTTIDNLKSTLEGVLEHPKSEKVKSNLAKQLTVLVGDTHILFNFHPLAKGGDTTSIIVDRRVVASRDAEQWARNENLDKILDYWELF